MAKTPARIVHLDIENAPSCGWTWGPKWETSIIEFVTDFYLLSFAWKWDDEKKVHVLGLDDFPSFRKDMANDRHLLQELWKILDEADIVIGHNVDRFDIRKINARFLVHGMPPPSPYKTVDTLKIAKRYFNFDSNKLDDLGRCLGVGRKIVHTGFELWRECMAGNSQAWRNMKRYNQQDVALLVKVYYLLRAWSGNHPNVNKGQIACPKCASTNVQRRGFSYTLQRIKQRFRCMSCQGWYEGSAKRRAA